VASDNDFSEKEKGKMAGHTGKEKTQGRAKKEKLRENGCSGISRI